MKKTDKKVKDYLERADKIMNYFAKEHCWTFFYNAGIEIAKMIQVEEINEKEKTK